MTGREARQLRYKLGGIPFTGMMQDAFYKFDAKRTPKLEDVLNLIEEITQTQRAELDARRARKG